MFLWRLMNFFLLFTFFDKFLITIRNNHLTSHLEYNIHIIISWQRGNTTAFKFKRPSIEDNKKLYDPKFHLNTISAFEDILVFVVINIIFEPY